MFPLAELQLGDQLARNATTALHRAADPDGRDLLIRVPVSPLDPRARDQLRNERRVTDALAGSDVAVLAPLPSNGGGAPFLAYPDGGLEPLSRWHGRRNAFGQALGLALAVARAVATLHGQGLVHLRLQPGSVLVEPASRRVILTDLGLAVPLDDGPVAPLDPSAVPQDLAWISPEQTGRVDRGIDQRSDLYSLGVLLFQLFSGRLPLEASSVSQWVHRHIALRPTRLDEVATSVPSVLARIVDRLLEKSPDDRYQSAEGLVSDLERCQQEWSRAGTIRTFTPGRVDANGRLQRPDVLHGRTAEAVTVEELLSRTGLGPALLLVSGPAGAGKTFLVEQVLSKRPATSQRVLRGKAEHARRELPYDILLQAFEQLAQQVAGGAARGAPELRERVRSGIGPSGRALLDLAPRLKPLLGSLQSAPELPPDQARNRLHLACRRLIQACCQPDRPLVLFLDDLHRADRATLDLLEELLRSREVGDLLVIATLREGETRPELREAIGRIEAGRDATTRIRLGSLAVDDMVRLVAESLAARPEAVLDLAIEVARKTAGNPYFAGEFLAAAVRSGDLWFDRADSRWSWNAERIAGMAVPDGLVGLVTDRLKDLDAGAQAALARGACIGGSFSGALLADSLGISRSDLEDILAGPAAVGLITLEGGPEPRWRFNHDRVQEAALALLEPDERSALHLRVGRALAARRREGRDDVLFQATAHLNQARELLTDEGERRELARLDLEAGRRALAAGSREAAFEALEAGLDLLGPAGWSNDYELTLDLHVAGAGAALLVGEAARADALIEQVRGRACSPLDRSRVLQLGVQRAINQLRFSDAIEQGLELLAELGIEVDGDPSPERLPEALGRIEEARAGRSFDELSAMPDMADPTARAALKTLCDILPAATMARPELTPALTIEAIELVLVRGLCPEAAAACSTWGLLLCVFGMHEEGYGFGQLAVRLMNRYPGDLSATMVAVQFPVFIQHHREPLRACVRGLEEGVGRCLDAGALDNYGYCENQGWALSLLAGEPLDQLEARWLDSHERLLEASQNLAANTLACFGQVVANLRGHFRPAESWRLSGERYDLERRLEDMVPAGFQMGVFFGHLAQLMLAMLFGHSEVALEHLRAARPFADTCRSMFFLPVYDFYAGLALVAAMEADGADPAALSAELEAHRDRLAASAAVSPSNHGFRLELLDGMLAGVEGRDVEALAALDRGIRAAGRGGFVVEAALGHELTAGLHEARNRPSAARAHLLAARCIQQTWGARAKAEQLEHRLVELGEGGMPFSPSAAADSASSLDLDTVLRVAEVISGQMDLDRLVARLLRFAMENAGAERGLLFLERDGEAELVAQGRVDADRVQILTDTGDVPDSAAVRRVLDYVLKARTSLALDDAQRSWPFSQDGDPPERVPRSLLALPLESRGDLVGVLYLENELVGGAFSRPRMDLLRVVASLAATMLENARLLATLSTTSEALRRSNALLERYSSDLEGRVDRRTQELGRLYRDHQMILESIEEGILRLDGDGRITFSNPAAERLTGWAAAELDGRSHHLLLDELDPEAPGDDGCPLCRPAQDGPAGGAVVPLELMLRRQHGEPLPVELSARPIRDPDGEQAGTVVTFRDITRRRQLQMQLEHAQRLETLGRFVGAVAHDFNNLLTPLMGGAAQLLDQDDLEPDSRHLLSNMERASRRASELVQQMLAFGRRTKIFMQPTDLGSVVDEVAGFLHHALSRGIALEVDRPDEMAWTWGDRVQIHQVLLNLCVNAQDALETSPQAGVQPRIRIGISEVRVDADHIPSDSTAEPGCFLRLEVSDNGPGIPGSTAQRMFEPFFTTKEAGKGTGLGLSVVYGIVRSHRGWVTCDTAPGRGATFAVFLPARSPASGEWAMVSSYEGEPAQRQIGRILVVDDEAMVRDLVATSLRRRGHDVIEAASGREALALHAEHGDTIDLVLLDLVMPELPGEEVLAQLLEADPAIKVCLVSGYAEGTAAESYRDLGATGFLAKPFTVRQLADLIQNALER